MNHSFILTVALAIASLAPVQAQNKVNIGKSDIQINGRRLTPEALWAMGRISA